MRETANRVWEMEYREENDAEGASRITLFKEDTMIQSRTRWTAGVCIAVASLCLFLLSSGAFAADTTSAKFQEYRKAIKADYGIDIKTYKDTLKGGRADGRDITKYDLQQLLMGIKIEQEHTTNKLRALEISMDHLEEFPDYYTRLTKMEEEAEKEMEAKKRAGTK